MPFKKGHKGFKPKGSEAKVKKDLKLFISDILDKELENIPIALEDLRENDSLKYLTVIKDLIEYIIPKLARTQNEHSGEIKQTTWIETKTYDSEQKANTSN